MGRREADTGGGFRQELPLAQRQSLTGRPAAKKMLNQALANWLPEPPGSAKEAVRVFAFSWTACVLFCWPCGSSCCLVSMAAKHDRPATKILSFQEKISG